MRCSRIDFLSFAFKFGSLIFPCSGRSPRGAFDCKPLGDQIRPLPLPPYIYINFLIKSLCSSLFILSPLIAHFKLYPSLPSPHPPVSQSLLVFLRGPHFPFSTDLDPLPQFTIQVKTPFSVSFPMVEACQLTFMANLCAYHRSCVHFFHPFPTFTIQVSQSPSSSHVHPRVFLPRRDLREEPCGSSSVCFIKPV